MFDRVGGRLRGGRWGSDRARGQEWLGDAGVDGRGGGRGGGRSRRIFDAGQLRLVLLTLIADAPRHGYDLIRAIEERTDGAYAPSPGVIYPTLTMLGEMGLIAEQATDGPRKLFAVTTEGTAHLVERASEVSALLSRLDALVALRQKTDPAPVRRAIHNLRFVLQNALSAGLDDTRLHAAVELIDEAARKIERL